MDVNEYYNPDTRCDRCDGKHATHPVISMEHIMCPETGESVRDPDFMKSFHCVGCNRLIFTSNRGAIACSQSCLDIYVGKE